MSTKFWLKEKKPKEDKKQIVEGLLGFPVPEWTPRQVEDEYQQQMESHNYENRED